MSLKILPTATFAAIATMCLVLFASPAFSQSVASVELNFFELNRVQYDDNGNVSSWSLDGYFLTADPAESQVVVQRGYPAVSRYQPTAFVFSRQVQNSTPFYRYRSRTSGDHFYTTSQTEGDQAVSRFDYIPEGICCYIFATQVSGSVPLYRLAGGAFHYYTTDALLREQIKAHGGFVDEGIAGFVLPSQGSANLN